MERGDGDAEKFFEEIMANIFLSLLKTIGI